MIERINFQGKQATAAYITNDFQPTDAASAEMVKIVTDDGDVYWLKPQQNKQVEEEQGGR